VDDDKDPDTQDSDGDGIPDFLDWDDDNDGIPDEIDHDHKPTKKVKKEDPKKKGKPKNKVTQVHN